MRNNKVFGTFRYLFGTFCNDFQWSANVAVIFSIDACTILNSAGIFLNDACTILNSAGTFSGIFLKNAIPARLSKKV